MKSTLTLTLATCFTASLAQAANYELVWSDEFDGNSLDQSKWSYQLGGGAGERQPEWQLNRNPDWHH